MIIISAFDVITFFYLLGILIFIYSILKNGFKYAFLEFIIIFSIGLGFETFNITINQHYSYPNSFFYIGSVAVSILVAWYSVFMFGKFWSLLLISVINSITKKSDVDIFSDLSIIPIVILSTSYITSTVVLLIDPLATRVKWWEWYEEAPYLDVPVGEIYGIFFGSILIGIFFWGLFFYAKINSVVIKSKIDIVMIVLYEIMNLVILYWAIISSFSNEDVLMGSSVVFVATQVPIVLTYLIYANSEEFDSMIKNFISNSEKKIKFIIYLGFFFSLLVFFLILFSMDLFIPLNLKITSFHMILIQFFFVIFLLNSHLYIKVKKLKKELI